MKKQLLLTVALGVVASAFAANPAVSNNEVETANASSTELLKSIKYTGKLEAMKTVSAAQDAAALQAIQNAPSTDSLTARYAVPAGVWYLGCLQGYWLNTLSSNRFLIPNEVELTWKGTGYYASVSAGSWKSCIWNYEEQSIAADGSVSINAKTYTKGTLTTPPYYNLYTSSGAYCSPAPILNLNPDGEGSLPSTYQAVPGGMIASYGTPRFNFGSSIGVRNMALCQFDLGLVVSGNWSSNLTSTSNDEIALVSFTNVKPGENYYTDAYMTRYGAYIEVSEKTFGIDSIVITGGFDSFKNEGITVDVYEAEPVSGKTTYTLGKHIGHGFLPADEVRVDPGYIYPITIPMVDEMGEPSFVNITKNSIILIGGYSTKDGSVQSLYNLSAPYSKDTAVSRTSPLASMYHNCVIEIADNETDEIIDVRYVQPGNTNSNGIPFRGIGWFLQYYGGYATLVAGDEPEDYFTMDVPAEGGEKEFVFNPTYDIATAGKVTGEGANDWVIVEVADQDFVDYTQTVTLTVEALPEGVDSRETTIYVEICGAQQAIKVTQGSPSGINDIAADKSDVVATKYFDLQGRQLNAVPETGLYLKEETTANGNVNTVKVAK
ncbi:MAG: hypothetical protein NC343_05085 [Muribaculum sp.]|nr:hypothetical protein [Muribaculaceae bacterium]MCM1081106.1 hypothetical protein [Muribaculum sp.]